MHRHNRTLVTLDYLKKGADTDEQHISIELNKFNHEI
jgi:hypothetical protein